MARSTKTDVIREDITSETTWIASDQWYDIGEKVYGWAKTALGPYAGQWEDNVNDTVATAYERYVAYVHENGAPAHPESAIRNAIKNAARSVRKANAVQRERERADNERVESSIVKRHVDFSAILLALLDVLPESQAETALALIQCDGSTSDAAHIRNVSKATIHKHRKQLADHPAIKALRTHVEVSTLIDHVVNNLPDIRARLASMTA